MPKRKTPAAPYPFSQEDVMNTHDRLQKMLMAEPKKIGRFTMKDVLPRIKLGDGESVSIQASSHHYCTPRGDAGPYIAVEIGFPTCHPGKVIAYAEDADAPTDTVYGYVPIELVVEFIDAHGGIATGGQS